MSERMIEIQRAKLGLPPMIRAKASAPSATFNNAGLSDNITANGLASNRNGGSSVASSAELLVQQRGPTPLQAAASAMSTEDQQLTMFLQKLQERNDSDNNTASNTGPTVPIALSRRMLQRQGVGYLDETVAAVTSAAADRFLATVLQQSIACRDQRIKGAEQAREEARQRRRHRQQYLEDSDDRRRRKVVRQEARRKSNRAAIAAAEMLGNKGNKQPKDGLAPGSPTKVKKKKKKPEAALDNGNKKTPGDKNNANAPEDDESSYDSLDEEEEYYQTGYGEEGNGDDNSDSGGVSGCDTENEDDEEDDTRYTMLLRDMVPPLEAWNIQLTGKLGVGAAPAEKPDENESDDDENEEEPVVERTEAGQLDGVSDASGGEAPPSPVANSKTPAQSPPSKGSSSNGIKVKDMQGAMSTSRATTPAPQASAPKPS